ncbi:murein L,D-transpeptidase [Budviciaceae bacterium CWB-B4]|uniref:Murein L,D-transpeptidase n=1 Tax=Limnobaculum xujianqingii TaxID=2738837 RepID=A0A9D7FZC2_9GAMM|nr:murein L,D-transpeptidase family protein [Limnobaculum xujianqingii]MBK5074658.1 murein L,D-transpeptidase [Limnobaculum xujianqingii]MBK5178010.1 murein L,D-transpeptidase [Limnobaculum xujianqingii]
MKNVLFIIILVLIVIVSLLIYQNLTSRPPEGPGPDDGVIHPRPPETEKQIKFGDRLYIRILKAEDKFELWFSSDNKPYELYKSYIICTYSGGLGPKKKQGDHKSPEGFYSTTKGLLNPNSSYHLSFNIGYPNAFDRANGYTGDFLMVHGGCASAGCYAMTDPIITEIYGLVEQAFAGGQKVVPIHIFPFAMTKNKMTQYQDSEYIDFWQTLKPAYDAFESNHRVPVVEVRDKRYLVRAG